MNYALASGNKSMPLVVGSIMSKTAALLVAATVLAACEAGSPDVRPPENQGSVSEPTEPVADSQRRTVAIYAAVIGRLVTKDHTFGGPSPFEYVYVLDRPKGRGANPDGDAARSDERFSKEVKRALKVELASLPPIDFVSKRKSVLVGKGLAVRVKNNGVIISVGPIVGQGRRVKVSNSLWCGGLCGQWLTYEVESYRGRWEVIGTTGPITIS